jgi:hypothetical protein
MRWIISLGSGLLVACTVQQPAQNGNGSNDTAPTKVAPPAAPTAPTVPAPAGVPTNATENAPLAAPKPIVSEAPFSDTSAQGAANVVQTYYALIEARKYKQAHQLWGPSSDLADGTFAAQFAGYREYHAEVDAPGEIEGAAGSLYVEVPVRTYGVTVKGEKFEKPAVVTLRRVNNVDGSTPEQRRWHIATIDRHPSPH